MKNVLFSMLVVFSLASCHHDTIEDRAQKMVDEYTERYCPTPMQDNQRTDSITFDRASHTFCYYFTVTGDVDNKDIIIKVKKKLSQALLDELKENTNYKLYKDAGYNFRYVFRSMKTGDTLYEQRFTKRDYSSSKTHKKVK